jgi:heme oxygenase
MNNLKKLTWEAHHNAERQQFAKTLLSGKITPQLYYKYLYNQYHIYMALEERLDIPEIEDVKRLTKIKEDIKELEELYDLKNTEQLCSSTIEYMKYVSVLDKSKIISHIYVRHFGDMYGGQIIKKRIPGSGKMYDFDNVENLKTIIRNMLDDTMADEAKVCFDFATKLFQELSTNE